MSDKVKELKRIRGQKTKANAFRERLQDRLIVFTKMMSSSSENSTQPKTKKEQNLNFSSSRERTLSKNVKKSRQNLLPPISTFKRNKNARKEDEFLDKTLNSSSMPTIMK